MHCIYSFTAYIYVMHLNVFWNRPNTGTIRAIMPHFCLTEVIPAMLKDGDQYPLSIWCIMI